MAGAQGFQGDVRQALDASIALLADMEKQIKGVLGMDAASSITDATEQQLHQVPQSLLQALNDTVEVIQELHKQLPAHTHTLPEGGGSREEVCVQARIPHDAAVATQHSPAPYTETSSLPCGSPSSTPAILQHINRCKSATPTSSQPKPCSTGSSCATQHSPTRPVSSGSNGKTNSVVDIGLGTRIGMYGVGAEVGRTAWLAAKAQQAREAAGTTERALQKEQQLFQSLCKKRLAAEDAHNQAMQGVKQLVQLTNALQVLTTADVQWSAYLAKIKQELQQLQ